MLAAGCGSQEVELGRRPRPSTAARAPHARRHPGTFSNGTPAKGGTYRVGWEQSFGFTDNFDPTGEYLGNAWGLYSNLMLRTLVGYKHLPGAAGNDLDRRPRDERPDADQRRPDLHVPRSARASSSARRSTAQSRRRTSPYAMNRLANPKDGGQYSLLLHGHQGLERASRNGKAKTISGITTPNTSTIVFHLTKPTGDFNLRMSMPATAPIPPEVGKCFEGQAGRLRPRRRSRPART